MKQTIYVVSGYMAKDNRPVHHIAFSWTDLLHAYWMVRKVSYRVIETDKVCWIQETRRHQ